jgi:hypothetical protein
MTAPREKLPPQLLDALVQLLGESGRGGKVRVLGTSMTPTLREGETLEVEFAPGPLRRGDVLVFRQADYLVVHRLLGRARMGDGRPCLRTRGDGRVALDPPLETKRVVGRVVAVERDGTWRSLRGRGARAYALALAIHDLAWAALASLVARRADRALRAAGLSAPLHGWTAAADRSVLRVVHALLFDAVHPRIPEPTSEAARGG